MIWNPPPPLPLTTTHLLTCWGQEYPFKLDLPRIKAVLNKFCYVQHFR